MSALSVHLIFSLPDPAMLKLNTAFLYSQEVSFLHVYTIAYSESTTNVFVADFIKAHYSSHLSKHLYFSHLDYIAWTWRCVKSPSFTPVNIVLMMNKPLEIQGHPVTGNPSYFQPFKPGICNSVLYVCFYIHRGV